MRIEDKITNTRCETYEDPFIFLSHGTSRMENKNSKGSKIHVNKTCSARFVE